jgi:flagellar basal body-associated protein FliL
MKYSKTTKIITILVIVLFLFATFGVVVLYLSTPTQNIQQELTPEMLEVTQPTIEIDNGTGDVLLSGDELLPTTGSVIE